MLIIRLGSHVDQTLLHGVPVRCVLLLILLILLADCSRPKLLCVAARTFETGVFPVKSKSSLLKREV